MLLEFFCGFQTQSDRCGFEKETVRCGTGMV